MDNIKLLMETLKCGVTVDNKLRSTEISSAVLSELYSLSKKHDLAHLVGYVLEQNNLLDKQTEIGKKFNEQIKMAIYRVTKIEYDYQEICQILNSAKIPYIPLKGAVIRRLYPKSWLRTSCDIDILVKYKDLKKACKLLAEKGYERKEQDYNCIKFVAHGGTYIELHFNLNEKDIKLDNVLHRVWNYAVLNDGCSYKLSNEFFIFYAVAHIVCHFRNGGCGIRTVFDLWLILNNFSFNERELNSLLKDAGIEKFYKNIVKLANVWFGDEEPDLLTNKMQTYILTGGVYGTQSNKVGLSMSTNNNRVKHIFSRLFPKYSTMKSLYPGLAKWPVLLPIYWIRRIFKLVFKKDKAKKAINEIKVTKSISQERIDTMKNMLDELGLK